MRGPLAGLQIALNASAAPADLPGVLRRSAKLVAVYLVGILLIGGWSLSHVLGGTVTRENFALVAVLPLAWTFSYWPMAGSALLAWKVWRLQATLETWVERRALGLPVDSPERELEDTLALLLAHENHIPERWARFLVRKGVAVLRERASQPDTAVAHAPGPRAGN